MLLRLATKIEKPKVVSFVESPPNLQRGNFYFKIHLMKQ